MDILLNNAYRILGLPVTATKREIVRRAEEIQTFVTIGETPHYETDLPWIGDLQRNEETVKKALQALENPSTKLEHVISWFWVIDEHDKRAMDALVNEDVDKAFEVWVSAGLQKVSHHKKNLATIEQIRAIKGFDSEFNHLTNAITYWADLNSSAQLWGLIEDIDPELSKNLSDTDIMKFVNAHLSQTAMPLFKRWADDGQLNQIEEFLSWKGDDLFTSIISYIKKEYAKPLSEKIDTICDDISEIDDDYEKIYTETKMFYKKINPYFERLKQSGDGFLIEKYGDKIGSIILERAIDYGNSTHQWRNSKELCELAETAIIGSLLKEKLKKNLEVISDNVEKEKVWGDLKPIERAPSLGTVNGIGTTLYGRSNYDTESGSYETTKYFVFFMIPIFPLSRYRVIQLEDNYYRFLGKVPFRPFDKWHLGLLLLAIFFCVVYGIATTDSKRSPTITRKPRNASYLKSNEHSSPQTPSQFVYAKVRCNIRSGPGLNYSVVRKASRGEKLEYSSMQGNWYNLKVVGGRPQEWVHESVVTFDDVFRTQSRSSSVSHPGSTFRTSTSRINEIWALRKKTNDAKQELRKMETALSSLERNLESYKDQLNGLKEKLTDMERRKQLGLYVDYQTYKNEVNHYNDLVKEHNSCLAKYRVKSEQYKSLLDATNADIGRYNRLKKSKR